MSLANFRHELYHNKVSEAFKHAIQHHPEIHVIGVRQSSSTNSFYASLMKTKTNTFEVLRIADHAGRSGQTTKKVKINGGDTQKVIEHKIDSVLNHLYETPGTFNNSLSITETMLLDYLIDLGSKGQVIATDNENYFIINERTGKVVQYLSKHTGLVKRFKRFVAASAINYIKTIHGRYAYCVTNIGKGLTRRYKALYHQDITDFRSKFKDDDSYYNYLNTAYNEVTKTVSIIQNKQTSTKSPDKLKDKVKLKFTQLLLMIADAEDVGIHINSDCQMVRSKRVIGNLGYGSIFKQYLPGLLEYKLVSLSKLGYEATLEGRQYLTRHSNLIKPEYIAEQLCGRPDYPQWLRDQTVQLHKNWKTEADINVWNFYYQPLDLSFKIKAKPFGLTVGYKYAIKTDNTIIRASFVKGYVALDNDIKLSDWEFIGD